MKKTYEEMLHDAFCECMQNNHGKDWVDRYDPEEQENMRREFYSGAEWQAMQALSQEQIDTTLSDYINSTKAEDKLQFGLFSLISISSMAIDANSAKTTLSTEFTHKDKRYKAEMLITQKEV